MCSGYQALMNLTYEGRDKFDKSITLLFPICVSSSHELTDTEFVLQRANFVKNF